MGSNLCWLELRACSELLCQTCMLQASPQHRGRRPRCRAKRAIHDNTELALGLLCGHLHSAVSLGGHCRKAISKRAVCMLMFTFCQCWRLQLLFLQRRRACAEVTGSCTG